ncbi:hypothetical protein TYRP_007014 [Tyrophagus putrescentiae]|nr:hypothetical protein TYRP_007014 [Tyrophagus putrescentiae]
MLKPPSPDAKKSNPNRAERGCALPHPTPPPPPAHHPPPRSAFFGQCTSRPPRPALSPSRARRGPPPRHLGAVARLFPRALVPHVCTGHSRSPPALRSRPVWCGLAPRAALGCPCARSAGLGGWSGVALGPRAPPRSGGLFGRVPAPPSLPCRPGWPRGGVAVGV